MGDMVGGDGWYGDMDGKLGIYERKGRCWLGS